MLRSQPRNLPVPIGLALAALLLSSCGGGDGDGTADDGAGGESSADDSSSIDGGATVTVDGTTYEITEVLDCTVGNEGYPDDRKFIGESADGTVHFSVFYLDLGGNVVPDVSLEVGLDGNDYWTWASSYAGVDGAYEIDVQADGAEGSSDVRVVGLDAPNGDFTMTWSFSCEDR